MMMMKLLLAVLVVSQAVSLDQTSLRKKRKLKSRIHDMRLMKTDSAEAEKVAKDASKDAEAIVFMGGFKK